MQSAFQNDRLMSPTPWLVLMSWLARYSRSTSFRILNTHYLTQLQWLTTLFGRKRESGKWSAFHAIDRYMHITAALGTYMVRRVSIPQHIPAKFDFTDKVGVVSTRHRPILFWTVKFSCRAAVVSPIVGVWMSYAIAIAYDLLASGICVWYLLRLKGELPL